MANREEKIKTMLQLREKEAQMRAAVKEAEEKFIVPIKDNLNKNLEMQGKLEDSIIEELIKDDLKTVMYDDKNITWSSRKSIQITNEKAVMTILTQDKDVLKRIKGAMGLGKKDVLEALIKTSLNTTKAKEIIDSLIKVDGYQVEGTEIKETKFLTVK